MKKYNKIFAGFIGLVLLLIVSTMGYNALKDKYGNQNQFHIEGNVGDEAKNDEQSDVQKNIVAQKESDSEDVTDAIEDEEANVSKREDETMVSNQEARMASDNESSGEIENAEEENAEQENDKDENANNEQELTLAPDFKVYDNEGNEVTLASKVGKPMVVNFWASWCGPCKSEMPDFQTMYEELGGEVEFMMVNLTDGMTETKQSALKYVNEQQFTFPVYFDTEDNAAMTYSITSIPTTILINSEGFIVASARGMIDLETIRYGIGLIMPSE